MRSLWGAAPRVASDGVSARAWLWPWSGRTSRASGPISRAPSSDWEPIVLNEELVGRCTSGGFGWRLGKSLALAMVRPDLSSLGTDLEVSILRLGADRPE